MSAAPVVFPKGGSGVPSRGRCRNIPRGVNHAAGQASGGRRCRQESAQLRRRIASRGGTRSAASAQAPGHLRTACLHVTPSVTISALRRTLGATFARAGSLHGPGPSTRLGYGNLCKNGGFCLLHNSLEGCVAGGRTGSDPGVRSADETLLRLQESRENPRALGIDEEARRRAGARCTAFRRQLFRCPRGLEARGMRLAVNRNSKVVPPQETTLSDGERAE